MRGRLGERKFKYPKPAVISNWDGAEPEEKVSFTEASAAAHFALSL